MDSSRIPSFAIVGTGAIGGFYGARLQRAGHEVHFLLRGDYSHVRDHGLRIDSKDGDFVLPRVNAYDHADLIPPCDVAIVALKTVQNALLPAILPGLVKPGGVVLVLQNGLGAEENIAGFVENAHIVGGLCFICSNKIGPGHICHIDFGSITMAPYSPDGQAAGTTSQVLMLAEHFKMAGVFVRTENDLPAARWKKLVWNIPYNGLSVVLNATTDQLMKNGSSRDLITNIMEEVIMGAASCGHPIFPEYAAEMLEYTDSMPPYKTSMKIDYDEKRPLEIESIFGNPVRAIYQAQGRSPRIEMLYEQLRYLNDRNCR
jgi:2-dehydropantoate 2-reductase